MMKQTIEFRTEKPGLGYLESNYLDICHMEIATPDTYDPSEAVIGSAAG